MTKAAPGERKRQLAATISFFSESLRFIIIPLVLLELVMRYFPVISPQETVDIANTLIVFGGLVAVFSALEVYFPRGTWLKMIFGILSIAVLCLWFWAIFHRSEFTFSLGPLRVWLDISSLALLIIFAISLKAILHVISFWLARTELKEKERRKREAVMEFEEGMHAAVLHWQKEVEPDTVIHDSIEPFEVEEPDPPPPTEGYSRGCPICFKELDVDDEICPSCGAWADRPTEQHE